MYSYIIDDSAEIVLRREFEKLLDNNRAILRKDEIIRKNVWSCCKLSNMLSDSYISESEREEIKKRLAEGLELLKYSVNNCSE